MPILGHNLAFVRTPCGDTNIMQTEINEPKEGDYLSLKRDEEEWPIVICDEEIIHTFFARSPRPGSARQADGTWGKAYKAGDFLVNERRFPAICLGTLKFMWAPVKELEPIDIDMGRAIRDSTSKPLLAKAWKEYTGQYKGGQILEWKSLDFWKARLHAQRLDNSTPGGFKKEGLSAEKMPKDRKRKGTPNFKYPPGYLNEELDDEEPDDVFLPKANAAASKIKQESSNSISSDEMDALYGDAGPPYPTPSQSSKRSKLDPSGRFSARSLTPSISRNSRPTTATPSSLRHGTPYQSTKKKIVINDPNAVLIYVDNPHKMFKVQRSGLDASPLLSSLLRHHPEDGWYIMSPMLSSLEADIFKPISEYLDRREYYPNILDDGTVHVRFEGDLNPETLHDQIVRCGTIYQVAKTLEMPGLQDLAFRKLKALESHFEAPEILTVVELLFDIGSPGIRQYLTQHVASHYYSLVLAETEKTVEIMRTNEDLAKGVYERLSGKENEIKKEGVKEEEKASVGDETKEEGNASEPSKDLDETHKREKAKETNPASKLDDANKEGSMVEENNEGRGSQPNKNEDSDAAVSQTERDMVGMPLRRSDEEQTEEDWVQLVGKQSDLFEAF